MVDHATGTIVAEICHIHAQKPEGPRFNPSLALEEIHGFENLILMCGVHHKVIDTPENVSTYTVARLLEFKAAHEAAATGEPGTTLSDEQARVLIEQSVVYEENSVHMDFREAVFRVGGEGGHPGGGGGSGGVLVIVGSTRTPPGAIIQAGGRDGAFPGGGGGGAGALLHVGRELAQQEAEAGFSVSSIFAANAAEANGLASVLSGGWSHCALPQLPWNVVVTLVLVVELGQIAEDALIRVTIDANAPTGEIVATDAFDVKGLPPIDLTPRQVVARRVCFAVEQFGIWQFVVRSGEVTLARHRVEFRHA
jgi:hypothetical protein